MTQLEKLCSQAEIPPEKKLACEDLLGHQSLRVKNIIIHKKYRGQDNDLALIQLWPSQPDGQCAIMTDSVQHACLNQDGNRFHKGNMVTNISWTPSFSLELTSMKTANNELQVINVRFRDGAM